MLRIVVLRQGEAPTFPGVEALPALLADPGVFLWVDLSGPADEPVTQVVRDVFRFHPLAIEDCFAERERPKLESYDGYHYCITHGLGKGSSAFDHEVVELDAFLSDRYLVTYHAKESRSVDGTWEDVARSGDPLRQGPACLLYAILDRQVDGIEPVMDDFESALGALEERVLRQPDETDLANLVAFRRNIVHLRRWLGLQRDVVLRLSRLPLIPPSEALHFRDTHDHLSRFVELMDTYRDLTNTIQDATLSVINNRLGENMRFLTLFSVVLLPLTLLSGIYGMNFAHMPLLDSRYGFAVMLCLMLGTATAVLLFFRRKGWLRKKRPREP